MFGEGWDGALLLRCARPRSTEPILLRKIVGSKSASGLPIERTPDIGVLSIGGRGGIRTHGELPHDGFQDRFHRPLGHPSLTGVIIADNDALRHRKDGGADPLGAGFS
jgi:hypothetical protein